jgi:hypothetical protein
MFFENLEEIKFFGNALFDFRGVGELLFRFGIDLLVIVLIMRLIFYPIYKQKSFFTSYLLINISVFLVCILLNSLKLKIGFAFGLFAVFSIIRYRTEPIPIKEMTYLFVTIIVAVINALAVKKISYSELIACNVIITLSVYIIETKCLKKGYDMKRLRYEKIELIEPSKRTEMIQDLKNRTGLDVMAVKVGDIDFLNDTAQVRMYYKEN